MLKNYEISQNMNDNMGSFLNLIEQQKEKINQRMNEYNKNKLEIDFLLYQMERERNTSTRVRKAREVLKKETNNNVIIQTSLNLFKLFQNTIFAYALVFDIPGPIFTQIGFDQLEEKVNQMVNESEWRFQKALKMWSGEIDLFNPSQNFNM